MSDLVVLDTANAVSDNPVVETVLFPCSVDSSDPLDSSDHVEGVKGAEGPEPSTIISVLDLQEQNGTEKTEEQKEIETNQENQQFGIEKEENATLKPSLVISIDEDDNKEINQTEDYVVGKEIVADESLKSPNIPSMTFVPEAMLELSKKQDIVNTAEDINLNAQTDLIVDVDLQNFESSKVIISKEVKHVGTNLVELLADALKERDQLTVINNSMQKKIIAYKEKEKELGVRFPTFILIHAAGR